MTRGWCYGHYMRWRRLGDPGPAEFQKRKPSPPAQPCRVEGCSRPGNTKGDGMCPGHRKRVKLTGAPGPAEFWDMKPSAARYAPCSVEDCDRKDKLTAGYCVVHYDSLRRYGDPLTANRQKKRVCVVDGCERPNSSYGLCTTHALRRKKGKPLDPPVRVSRKGETCAVEGCDRGDQLKRGWCNPHYLSWARHGDPLAASEPRPVVLCCEDGCDAKRYAKDRCFRHYNRYRAEQFLAQGITCAVENCEKPPAARGLCSGHVTRLRLFGDPRVRSPLKVVDEGPFRVEPGAYYDDPLEDPQVAPELRNLTGPRSHCCRGHELTVGNVYQLGERRVCRLCMGIYRRRRRRTRAIPKDDRQIAAGYRKAIANDPCAYCGAPGEHVDHFYPVRKGGRDWWFNLVRACAVCNLSKGARCGTWFILKSPRPDSAIT